MPCGSGTALKGARDVPCSAQGTVPLTGGFLRNVSTLSSTWGKLLFWGCYITTWGKDKSEFLSAFLLATSQSQLLTTKGASAPLFSVKELKMINL